MKPERIEHQRFQPDGLHRFDQPIRLRQQRGAIAIGKALAALQQGVCQSQIQPLPGFEFRNRRVGVSQLQTTLRQGRQPLSRVLLCRFQNCGPLPRRPGHRRSPQIEPRQNQFAASSQRGMLQAGFRNATGVKLLTSNLLGIGVLLSDAARLRQFEFERNPFDGYGLRRRSEQRFGVVQTGGEVRLL